MPTKTISLFLQRTTLCLLLFIGINETQANNTLDSLLQLIEVEESPPIMYDQYVLVFKEVKPFDSLYNVYANQFIDNSKEKDYTRGVAKGLYYKAIHHFYISDFEACVNYSADSEKEYKKIDDPKGLVKALSLKGITFERFSMIDEAEQSIQEMLEIANETRDSSILGSTYKRLAEFTGNVKGDKANGSKYLDSAIVYANGDEELMAQLYYVKGNLLAQVDPQKGIESFLLAKDLLNKLGKSNLHVLDGLAYKYHYTGDLNTAIIYAEEMLSTARTENALREQIVAYSYLGNIYSDLKNDAKTIENHMQAIQLAKENNMPSSAMNSLFGLGLYYGAKKDSLDNIKAIGLIEEAIDLTGENVFVKTQMLPTLASFYRTNRQDEKAKLAYQEVIQVLEYNKSAPYYSALSGMGAYMIDEGNINKGKKYIEEAYDFAKEGNNFTFQQGQLKMLTELEADQKNYKNAYGYSMELLALEDSLNIAENQEAITTLELNHKFDQEKAIADAEQKAELQKAAAEKKFITGLLGGAGLLALMAFFAYRSKAKSNKLIKAQNTQLEELSASNEQLLFSLSHDIKEPMLGLQMLLDEIKLDDSMLDDAKTSLNTQVKSVNGILRNLLDIKKNQGQTDATVDGPQIFAIIQEVLESQMQKANSKHLSIDLKQEELASLSFDLSPQKFYLLMLNTINNAIKYSPVGGQIEISANKGELSIINGLKDIENASVKDALQSDGVGLALVDQLLAKTKVQMKKIIDGDRYVLNISSI